jgi:hypothetical protein
MCGLKPQDSSYIGMPPPSKRKAGKLRSWRVSILRARGEYLGDVQALYTKMRDGAQSAFEQRAQGSS